MCGLAFIMLWIGSGMDDDYYGEFEIITFLISYVFLVVPIACKFTIQEIENDSPQIWHK